MGDAGISPAVGIAGHGGIPGMPTLPSPAAAHKYQAAKSEEDAPPPQSPSSLGMVVSDEVYHKVGAANDVIIVKGKDGKLSITDFNVMFSRKESVKGAPPKTSSTLSTVNKTVFTYINGEQQPKLYLRVNGDGFCSFPDGRLQPPDDALAVLESGGLVPGINNVRFEIRYHRDPRVLVAECFAFMWAVNTPMIVVDIDGTITRSNVPGLVMTLRPGLVTDHTHAGICSLLTRMVEEEGAQVVYLTSRPIVLAPKTRAFLASTQQDGETLPLGPLQCCLESVSGVLWRELVRKDMHDYKINALLDLARPFREAGRTFGEAVFAAGIGNKVHDAVSYKAAGIPEDFIFLIDPESNLRVWDGDDSKLGGSADSRPIAPLASTPTPSAATATATAADTAGDVAPQANDRYTPPLPLSLSGSTGSWRRRVTTSSSSGADREDRRASLTSSGSWKRKMKGVPGGASWRNSIGRSGAGGDGSGDTGASGGSSGNDDSRCSNGNGGGWGVEGVESETAKRKEETVSLIDDPVGIGGEPFSSSSSSAPAITSTATAAATAPAVASPAYFTVPPPGRMSFSKPSGEKFSSGPSSSSLSSSASPPPQAQELQGQGQARVVSRGYRSYADERFFSRLRASLDLAAWEAGKAVEAGVHAAAQAAHAAHVGVQGPLFGHEMPLRPRRGSGAGGGDRVEESGEQAARRLAERVHTMSLETAAAGARGSGGRSCGGGSGGGGELHPLERQSSE